MAKEWYDYETESGNGLIFPRMHFRTMLKVREIIRFPFDLTTPGDLYIEPFDIYTPQDIDAEIIVMGSDAHCHVGKELGKFKEAIAFFCDETDKDETIKQISKIA